MKKIIATAMMAVPMIAMAQSAVDAYSLSQTDLKGTARYMSMAGAYGALGGDLTAINQNPGGIGVYRSSDIGLTLDLDIQSTESKSGGVMGRASQTKFYCNNFGYVGAFKLDSEVMPFFNIGISYNRPVSYNRRYRGEMGNIKSSLSNYIADITNTYGLSDYDLAFGYDDKGNVNYDPYIDSDAPWLSVMAYNSYLINPSRTGVNGNGRDFVGLMNDKTTGFAEYEVIEKGGVDEFNVNLGGNVSDMVYWGIGVGLTTMDMSKYTYYGEALTDATVATSADGEIGDRGTASYGLENWLTTGGEGLNFKLGVIVKPINELRIGASFHTPTYWTLTDRAFSTMSYETSNLLGTFVTEGLEEANAGYVDEVNYTIETPWKFNLSVATVLGGKAILCAEYERLAYDDMNVKYQGDFGVYYENNDVNNSIGEYYKAMDIYRIGAEYKLNSALSARLGYAYQSSPVKEDAMNGKYEVITAGTMPSYVFDKSTQYITGGLGYRHKGFYTDLAYVYKKKESEYKAFNGSSSSVISDSNHQVVWSIGYRF